MFTFPVGLLANSVAASYGGDLITPSGVDYAASLNGTSSLLSTTETLTSGLTNATLCGWIKPSAITSFREIFSGATSAEIEVRTSGGRLQIVYHTTGPTALITLQRGSATTLFNLDQWYHIAAVKEGRTFRMYIDGAFHAEVTAGSDSTLAATALRIGSVGTALRFAGKIADFRIYNEAIDDLREIINRATRTTNLIAHWPFSADADDISGNGYHLTPTSVTYAQDTSLFVPSTYTRFLPSNAGVYWSPYNWYSKGGSLTSNNIASGASVAITNTPGAYFKTKFTGSTFGIQIAPYSLNDSDATDIQQPAIEYSIDGGSWTRYQIGKTDRDIVLTSSESAGEHTVEVMYSAVWATLDKWTDPVGLHIVGLFGESGSTLSPPTIKPNVAMFYGDSHAEGHEVSGVGVTIANQNARLAWPKLIADSLNCEYGVAGFASQGYTSTTGLIGDCEASWDLYSANRSRLVGGAFSPAPDYIFSGHGDNDSDDTATATAVDNLIAAWRTAAPSSKIFLLMAPNLTVETGIRNGHASAADANSYVVDTAINYLTTPGYYNGQHLSEAGQLAYSTNSLAIINSIISPVAAGVNIETTKTGVHTLTTPAIRTTDCDMMAVMVSWYSTAGTSPTITDSAGNTWSLAKKQVSASGGQNTGIFVAPITAANDSTTITVALTNAYMSAWVGGIIGPTTVGATSSATSASATSLAPGSVANSSGNVILSCCVFGTTAGSSATIDGEFDFGVMPYVSGASLSLGYGSLVGTGTAANPTWSWSPSQSNVCAAIAVLA